MKTGFRTFLFLIAISASLPICSQVIRPGLYAALIAAPVKEKPDEKGRTRLEIQTALRMDEEDALKRESRKADLIRQREKRLSLPLPGEECLAYFRGQGRCLVTAGEFNRQLGSDAHYLEDLPETKGESEAVFRIRRTLLSNILNKCFREEGLLDQEDGKRDLRQDAQDAWRIHLASWEKKIGEERLKRLYQEHYRALFAPKRKIKVEILGASDSVFLDSLVNLSLAPDSGNRGAGTIKHAMENDFGRNFRWQEVEYGDLPRELARTADELRIREVSVPIRCPYGWFSVAVTKEEILPAKTYPEALPLLIELAGSNRLPPWLTDKAPANKGGAPSLVRADRRGVEDSVALRTWLLPIATRMHGRKPAVASWKDTALVSCFDLRLADLPALVRNDVRRALRLGSDGILKSKFGVWYFRGSRALAIERQDSGGEGIENHPPSNFTGSESASLEGLLLDLSIKERDFKESFAERAMSSSPQESGGGASAYAALQAKWIAEHVSLEERFLRP